MNQLKPSPVKTLRSKILNYVRLTPSRLKNPDASEHTGRCLWNIYVWQEISLYADRSLKAAWHIAEEQGAVTKEDKLRGDLGSFSDASSTSFATSYRVDPPRMILDEEALLLKIADRYRIPLVDLIQIAKENKKPSKPPLTRRVVERSFVT